MKNIGMSILWKFRKLLLKAAIPITKLIGKMHAPFSHKKVKAVDYRFARITLKPGDVLIVRTRGEFSNLFIPSKYTHAAIFIGSDYILEALSEGVKRTDLIDFMLSKDSIKVYRSKKMDGDLIATSAKKYIGFPYDFLFDPGAESFYCFEFVWFLFHDQELRNKTEKFGLITGDDFQYNNEEFELITSYGMK